MGRKPPRRKTPAEIAAEHAAREDFLAWHRAQPWVRAEAAAPEPPELSRAALRKDLAAAYKRLSPLQKAVDRTRSAGVRNALERHRARLAAVREASHHVTKSYRTYVTACAICGDSITGQRGGLRLTCSDRCRQRLSRQLRAEKKKKQ